MKNIRFHKFFLCIFAVVGLLCAPPTNRDLKKASTVVKKKYERTVLYFDRRLKNANSERSLTLLEKIFLKAINDIVSEDPVSDAQRTAQEVILADLQEKALEINRKIILLHDQEILKRFKQEDALARIIINRSRPTRLSIKPYKGSSEEAFLERFRAEDKLAREEINRSPKIPRPAFLKTASSSNLNGGNYSVQEGRRARAKVDKRPMAEPFDYKLIRVSVAGQRGVNCAYHAFVNSKTCAAATMQEADPVLAIQRATFATRRQIEDQKNIWNGNTLDTRALDGYELMEFARSNLAGTVFSRMFESETAQNFYWFVLEYLNMSVDRKIITSSRKLLDKLRAEPESAEATAVREAASSFYLRDGTRRFPDRMSPIQQKTANLVYYQNILEGRASDYLKAIKLFRQEKTLITVFADSSGSGVGHWTCVCFVPVKRNPNSLRPDFVKVISMNSSGGSEISGDVKRFVFDLLYMDLPNPEDLSDQGYLNQIRMLLPQPRPIS